LATANRLRFLRERDIIVSVKFEFGGSPHEIFVAIADDCCRDFPAGTRGG
jgi:hypothetical protein